MDFQRRLSERKAQCLYRHRVVLDSAQGPNISVAGENYLSFCSNDYLGLANHPEVKKSFKRAVDEFGVGSGASNLITGHSRAHRELEEQLADFTGRPRALLFSTGYMANLGVMSGLMSQGDVIFQDRLNHASLLDAGRLSGARFQRFRHKDLQQLQHLLEASKGRKALIATDGIFSMDGDQQQLPELARLAINYKATFMLDDAHGFGVMGRGGRGSANEYELGIRELPVLMATLGKAAGTFGAFVAGSEELIESLIQFSRSYIYTTAMPPAVARATQTSLNILEREEWRRVHLKTLIAHFQKGCLKEGIPVLDSQTPIQPILIGTNSEAIAISQQLAEKGILITAIRPPTVPKAGARLRVTFSASHSLEQVDRLLEVLSDMPWHLFQKAA